MIHFPRFQRPALMTFLLLSLGLTACQPARIPEPEERPATVNAWPDIDFEQAAADGKRVFRLDAKASRIDIIVRREGPLARFGHDHVLVVRNPEGFLLLDQVVSDSVARLRFAVDHLDVDPTEERVLYQLDSRPDQDDISATRKNLLTRVLESGQWPFITIDLADLVEHDESYSATVTISVKNSQLNRREAFQLNLEDEQALIKGTMTLRQTELGLEPFSVMGGGLKVADQLEMHFSLTGRPL